MTAVARVEKMSGLTGQIKIEIQFLKQECEAMLEDLFPLL
jgi:hypothetical protein